MLLKKFQAQIGFSNLLRDSRFYVGILPNKVQRHCKTSPKPTLRDATMQWFRLAAESLVASRNVKASILCTLKHIAVWFCLIDDPYEAMWCLLNPWSQVNITRFTKNFNLLGTEISIVVASPFILREHSKAFSMSVNRSRKPVSHLFFITYIWHLF